ncbi:MAG TPA: gliding motility protein U, partial [Archangium sp.]
RRSRDAADLTMFVLETREEWFELSKLSRQFLDNKKLTKSGTDFAQRVAQVVEGSHYKWVDEVVYKKEKNPKKAAEEFIKFVGEFPKSENADRALTYAMIIFQDANELDRGVEAGERVLKEYPQSNFELKVRYTLASFYEKLAEFRKSAAMYEAFVAAYDDEVKDGEEAAKKAKAKGKAAPAKVAAKPGAEDAEGKRARKAAERKAMVAEAAEWVSDALFNAGVWWDGVGESQKAITAYNAYMSRFKDRKDVPQVAYSIALVHEKDGKWADAAKAFASFTDTYGRDARTSPSQHYVARYHEMLAWRQLKDTRNAERIQGELVRGWKGLPEQARQDTDALNAYAHARFLDLEPSWKRYTDIRFTRVATIRRDLANKQREIQRLEKEYAGVLATGSGEWGIAALTRIGLAYADFARNIMDSPDPQGLDEDQKAMYRGELENLAMPLEEKSAEALDKALAKAYELSLYNEWTLAAQEQVNKYKPGSYAQVRKVDFRGSEFFATADVLKDPGVPGSTTVPAAAPTPATESPAAPSSQDSGAPPTQPEAAAPTVGEVLS